MNIISSATILSEIADEFPVILPVLTRFGIKQGLGEHRVSEICSNFGINEEAFSLILNLYLNSAFTPHISLGEREFEQIKNYFQATDNFYRNIQIPNIESHLKAFIIQSDDVSTLKMIEVLFNKFKIEFMKSDGYFSDILGDIKGIMIKHLTGRFNTNLYYAVIFSLHSLEDDLTQHERLRSILLDKIAGIKQANKLAESFKRRDPGELTTRENDVLKLIVKGRLNKEIASELSISFNTVLTHRKNIISKLGIKSVPGLTLYAYISGLVSSQEIQN